MTWQSLNWETRLGRKANFEIDTYVHWELNLSFLIHKIICSHWLLVKSLQFLNEVTVNWVSWLWMTKLDKAIDLGNRLSQVVDCCHVAMPQEQYRVLRDVKGNQLLTKLTRPRISQNVVKTYEGSRLWSQESWVPSDSTGIWHVEGMCRVTATAWLTEDLTFPLLLQD